ncbi:sensor histidine kinase [Christiangramia salexigens]|uniref:Histidine kinase n=1 Tax=Christiangramia salexigens TaxID=1913577 RepID=A0A1L3J1Q9_9FLAO|nr:histidine kinase [Christiangramia salexigens]APG59050.1 histidine kinase [Christiangramia salexigens]
MGLSKLKEKYIDFRLVLLLAGFYLMFDIVLIGKIAYLQTFREMEAENFIWSKFLLHNIAFDYVIVLSYMTLIAISTKRFLNRNYSWVKIIIIHTIFSLLIGMVIRFLGDLYSLIFGRLNLEDYDIAESIYAFVYVIDLNFLIYFAMVFIIYTYYYLRQIKVAEKRHSKLESQLVTTRMKMLTSQLQPHFLFNTLNSITVLTDLDPAKARDTIADLSDFLREILYNSDNNRISLEEELRILEYYLNILNIRFSDHLKIYKNIDEDLLQYRVPALLLQPLIENSIKHGYSYDHTDLEIKISVYREAGSIVIKVENNGQSLVESHSHLIENGLGLKNIHDRLETLYQESYYFNISNKEDGSGVETIIKIPAQR